MAMIRHIQFGLSTVLLAVLAACGGGDDDPVVTKVPVTSLRVMGDSLADVGTYGFKFTIQGNDIYAERVAQSYGLGKGCNFFAFTGTTFAANPTAGCTNYAIGNSVINPASNGYAAADPRGLAVQLATATAAANFAAGDLLLVDGGANDASALVGAYLAAATDGGASYLALLGTVLTPAQVAAAAGGGAAGRSGWPLHGGAGRQVRRHAADGGARQGGPAHRAAERAGHHQHPALPAGAG